MMKAFEMDIKKPRVLFLFSGDPQARTDLEHRSVLDVLPGPLVTEWWEFRFLPSTKIGDIYAEISAFNPNILHIGGHGNASGDLMFDGEPLELNGFAETIVGTKRSFHALVLSACNAGANIELFRPCCECFIGCCGDFDDQQAPPFAEGFYRELCRQARRDIKSIDVAACFTAGNGEVRARLGAAFDPTRSMELLTKPLQFEHLRELLQPVPQFEYDQKSRAFFGIETKHTCYVAGLVAEVGGVFRSVQSECDLLRRLDKIHREARYFSEMKAQSMPSNTAASGMIGTGVEMDSRFRFLTLKAEVSALINRAKEYGEVTAVANKQSLRVSDVEIAETALLCKYENFSGAKSEVVEFCLLAEELMQTTYGPSPDVILKICDLAHRLSTAAERLNHIAELCLTRRLEGGVNATRKFGGQLKVTSAVKLFFNHLPHYDDWGRPGHPLWNQVRTK
jgi:hypothetical protein